jgi:hypothetical protein
MRRFHCYPLLMLLLLPDPVRALQLRWGSGTTNLTFTSAMRCTLVVQVDSAGARLPAEWRLLWVAGQFLDPVRSDGSHRRLPAR